MYLSLGFSCFSLQSRRKGLGVPGSSLDSPPLRKRPGTRRHGTIRPSFKSQLRQPLSGQPWVNPRQKNHTIQVLDAPSQDPGLRSGIKSLTP